MTMLYVRIVVRYDVKVAVSFVSFKTSVDVRFIIFKKNSNPT